MEIPNPVYVVIVAGGQGQRMGMAVPKQFLLLDGKPVLYYTVKAFNDVLPAAHLTLVLPEAQLSMAQMVLQHFPEGLDLTIVSGGATRFHSVRNGLQNIPANALVMVHDGVRPFVSSALIERCIKGAIVNGSAIPAIPVTDSIRSVSGSVSKPVDRASLKSVQTPQTFKAEVLLPAFRQEFNESFTDEATVVETNGSPVFLVDGEKNNMKITTPEDLEIAEIFVKK